jgi:rhodanese-related sulfurtransferase
MSGQAIRDERGSRTRAVSLLNEQQAARRVARNAALTAVHRTHRELPAPRNRLARLLQKDARHSLSFLPEKAADMTAHRLLLAALFAGAFVSASAQEETDAPLAPPIHVAGGASDPAAVKRVQQFLTQPWKYKARRLSKAEVDALLAKPDSVLFIDLRAPAEFIQYGSFPVFLSVQNKDLEKQLAWLPRDRQIVTVSNHSQRAGAAADLLASKGFNVAGATGSEEYEVEGGTAVAHLLPRAPRVAGAASAPRS